MTTQVPSIPAGFGEGGAYLAKNGAAGSPDLGAILIAMRSAIVELQAGSDNQDAGANLTNADATITRSQGSWRKLPAATLTANHTLTFGVTDTPVDGAQIDITKSGTEAFTYALVNGGAGGGTLYTFPSGKSGSAKVQYNGTSGAWELRSAALSA